MKRNLVGLAIAVVLVAAGFALKAVRYTSKPGNETADAIARVEKKMAPLGWHAPGGLEHRAGHLYAMMRFKKADCPVPVVIAFLPGNGESAALIRRDFQGNVIFWQNGVFVEEPSGLRRQIASLRDGLSRMLGLGGENGYPVMAIAPRDAFANAACPGPQLAAAN